MAKVAKHDPAHGHNGHAPDDHGDHGDGGHGDHGGGGHCPPPWILTFADMAVLLMAFFVIMLMSAKTDLPKFNAFASVMRQTFGRVPIDPNDADKGGTSILDLHFGPQSGEQTNETPGSRPQSGDPSRPADGEGDATTDGGAGKAAPDGVDEAAEALAKAMRDAVAKGEVTVESDAGQVVVRLPAGADAQAAQQIADALAEAAGAAGGVDVQAQAAGAQGAMPSEGQEGEAAAGNGGGEAGSAGSEQGGQESSGTGIEGPEQGAGAGSGTGVLRAKLAALKAGMLLESEMAAGAVDIEQRDGAVVVTVGAGGAFASGSADMTAEAQAIIERLGEVSGKAKRIVITGHTDNVPLSGSNYRDNWDLASARAGSVLRQIEASGLVPDAELVAQSKGETEPVADNSTPEGREKNRRVEIEIEFDE